MAPLIGARLRLAPAVRRGIFANGPGGILENNVFSATTGAAALTSPFWWGLISPAYQFVMAALGLVLLLLTIRAKILELRIKRADLRTAEAEARETEARNG